MTVVMLDRPRHAQLLDDIRAAGARIKMISDGDVAAGIQAALPNSGVDVLMGIGGTPEGVITAAAIRCTGGAIQCKPWPRDDAERQKCLDAGLDLTHVYTTEELVGGDDVFFSATGGSTGELLKGVNFTAHRRLHPVPGHALPLRHHPLGRLDPRLLTPQQGALQRVGPGIETMSPPVTW